MGMFGSGGGGDFNPNDWVDYKVYNEVMKNDTTSSTKSNTNSSKEVKIKNYKPSILNNKTYVYTMFGVFIVLCLVASVTTAILKESILVRTIVSLVPPIWLILMLIVSKIIDIIKNSKLQQNYKKEKEKNDELK